VKSRPQAAELDEAIVARITELCEAGDDDVENASYAAGIIKYRQALTLVPKPVFSWKVTIFILTSIAEAHYLDKDFAAARDALNEALRGDGAVGNPFLHLRLGQVELELGNRGRARDELLRAFTRGGEEVFAGEDPRYLAIVKHELEPSD
jgi:tetratricopeptide (TPR) repeat protein